MDPNLLIRAFQDHAWPVVAGFLITLFVFCARLPAVAAQWSRVPERLRPLVPVVIGILSGVGESLCTTSHWVAALLGGVISALPAFLATLPSPTATKPNGTPPAPGAP